MKRIVISIAAVIAAASCSYYDSPAGAKLQPGDPLPEFRTSLPDGTVIRSADFIGKPCAVILLDYTSAQCRYPVKAIQEILQTNDSFNAIGFCQKQDEQELADYLQSYRITFPVTCRDGRDICQKFDPHLTGIPQIYITDKEGFITDYFDWSNLPTRDELLEVIAKNLP